MDMALVLQKRRLQAQVSQSSLRLTLSAQVEPEAHIHGGPCGLMDKALVFGTKDCSFESCQGHAVHAGSGGILHSRQQRGHRSPEAGTQRVRRG